MNNILHRIFRAKSAPYILEKKSDMIRLEIMPTVAYTFLSILCISVLIIASISLFLGLFFLIQDLTLFFAKTITIIASILLFLYAFYLFTWERKGREIFVLSATRLENTIIIKPFKTVKEIYSFSQLIIGYESDEKFMDIYEEDEEENERIKEFDMEGMTGNYPIRFIINNGTEIVDSSRRIPIEVIRRIREEYLLIGTIYENK